jgi:hypothetical protein
LGGTAEKHGVELYAVATTSRGLRAVSFGSNEA